MPMDARTAKNLKSVHPDLAKVFTLAYNRADPKPVITSAPRTIAEQRALVKKGASKTMNSRHLPSKDGFVRALDICFLIGGQMRWDWPLYKKYADLMKAAGKELKIPVEWGGDWVSFKDGPHFQLPWKQYP